jgi:YD repeat-containing protein
VTGRVANDYDDRGRRVQATTETLGENQQRKWITAYEYDDMGNWIKELTTEQSSTSGKVPASAVLAQERQIQYYNLAENKVPYELFFHHRPAKPLADRTILALTPSS